MADQNTQIYITEGALEQHVPSLSEDPAERKRVLNVLAQRRYSKLI